MQQAPDLSAIETAIREATGNRFTVVRANPMGGGDIHTTLCVESPENRYVVKLGTPGHADMFEAEKEGLIALSQCRAFRIPQVITCTRTPTASFLVLEYLDLRPLQSSDDGERFATALAELHSIEEEAFGWHRTSYLGTTPQDNTPSQNWSQFMVRQRLVPQLEAARTKGFRGDFLTLGERLLERIPALFLDYRPRASLLHGDLWNGNAAMSACGKPATYDPAVHCGDRESDLAMTELFGGFPSSFYATYRRLLPGDSESESRKPLYKLYHILNHLNLFGRSYQGEADRLTKRLFSDLCNR